MSLVVFAAPPSTPIQPGPVGPQNLTMTWTGWNGDVFPLLKSAGTWLDASGIRGLGMPDLTHFKRQPASINGSIWYGYVIPERQVFWPLHIKFDEDLDRRFWRTMLPYKTGTWSVQTPSGQVRSIDLRITDDGQWAPEGSPFLLNHALYGLTLAAEQPLWRGSQVFQSWSPPVSYLFFGGGDPTNPTDVANQSGPPFVPSQSSSFNDAQMINDGDVEAWPVWVIDGPATTATVGIGADTISIPFAVDSGQRLVIDTNPTVQEALMGTPDPDSPTGLLGTPANKTTDLTSITWGMIPPGETVDVSITATGSPVAVGVGYTPLFLRAW